MRHNATIAAPGDCPGVNYYSPVGAVSSVGSGGRGYLAALRAAEVPVAVVPIHEVFVHQPGFERQEPRQRPIHPIALVQVNADTIHRFLHFHARSFQRARYKIAIWAWELPALHDEWAAEIAHFDEIWSPSTFCQRAVQAMTAKPVTLAPQMCPTSLPAPANRQELQIGKDEFVFLYVFDSSSMVERKNPRCLIEAFQAAFSGSEKVRLVLKVSNSREDGVFSAYLEDLVARDSRCTVLRQTMTPEGLAGLMRACDCYVSPHRSEGYGLTIVEAMALGMPVIATNYGGPADFVTDEVGYPLRYRLVEVERDHGPYTKGAIWSDPSREHLSELMRRVVADPEAAAEKGRRARALMLRDYSAAAIGRRMRERLTAIASELLGETSEMGHA